MAELLIGTVLAGGVGTSSDGLMVTLRVVPGMACTNHFHLRNLSYLLKFLAIHRQKHIYTHELSEHPKSLCIKVNPKLFVSKCLYSWRLFFILLPFQAVLSLTPPLFFAAHAGETHTDTKGWRDGCESAAFSKFISPESLGKCRHECDVNSKDGTTLGRRRIVSWKRFSLKFLFKSVEHFG